MHDAHFHFSSKILAAQKKYGIPSLCSAASVKEWQTAMENGLRCSCGVHPWSASHERLNEMKPLLEQARIIGEIGMDSVWCDTDMALQKAVFVKQIEYAYQHHKPVVLHTKGQEQAILDILRQYPNTYIVHWYSDRAGVEAYDEIASYFTVGPSVGKDEAVTNLVRKIPLEKLLLESDGLEALEWACGDVEYVEALRRSIEKIAAIKGKTPKETERILDENFARMMEE